MNSTVIKSTCGRLAAIAAICVLPVLIPLSYAGNKANPDAIELAPIPQPVEFKSDMDKPVPFDATTTVSLTCPDVAGEKWLQSHFKEWYGDYAPKVVGGRASPRAENAPHGDEAYSISANASGVQGSSAAWGSAIPPTAPMYDTAFGTALRLVG